jgi:hypothetical protein
MNPRTDVKVLELQGANGNLRRALKRESAEAEAPAISPDVKSEIEELNALIAQALKCCRRGATYKKKSNPAFRQLESLIRCREMLRKGRPPGKKSAAEILADADRVLGVN